MLLIILFLIFTILFKNNKELFESIYYLQNTLFLQQRNNDEEVPNCLDITNDFKCNSLYPFDNDNVIIDSINSDTLNSYTKVYMPKGKKGDDGDIGIPGPVSTETNNFTQVNKINTQNNILPINVTNGGVNINTNNPIMLNNKNICKKKLDGNFCFNLNKLNETISNLNSLNTIQ